MSMIDALIGELDQETDATRRMLELVPADKLDWKPHERSMSLGQLALHIATLPGAIAGLMLEDTIEPPEFHQPAAESTDELLPALEESVSAAKSTLLGFDDASLAEQVFRVSDGETEYMALPKAALARAIMLNHWYHHRGQLSVYLRMLDVPLPVVYGATADENPFAAVPA